MKFHVIYLQAPSGAQSPVRVVEQTTGQEVGWVNRYLDREYVRRLADRGLRLYAHDLLHFVRWWAGIHQTGDVLERALTESTLLEYLRFQSGLQPRPSGSTINARIAAADRAPSATSFPTPLARLPEDSIKPICAADRWAWLDRAGQSAGCGLRNPNAASCRYPSTRWLGSGPVFAPPATLPSSV